MTPVLRPNPIGLRLLFASLEDLIEVADPGRQLVGDGVGEDVVVDDRVVLDVDWRILKIVRKLGRGWRGLGALADEPGSGEVILFRERKIDLGDSVEAVPGEVAVRLIVARGIRAGERVRRPQRRVGAAAIEQVVCHWIVRNAIEVEQLIGIGLVGCGGFGGFGRGPDQELLFLKADKPEELVLDSRAANCEAIVFIAGCRLAGRRRGWSPERIRCD